MASNALSRVLSLPRVMATSVAMQPKRDLRIFPPPPPHVNTVMPERHRLPVVPKVPTYILGFKAVKQPLELWRMYGEDYVNNQLQLGQYGIVAIHGGLMKHAHYEVLRNDIGRYLVQDKSFALYRVDAPYHPITRRGAGKKKGGGKGSINHYGTHVKAGRVIVEIGGKVLWEEVRPWLKIIAAKLPFEAIAVNVDMLKRMEAEVKRLDETNENPYTFEWLIRNNIFDCHRHISPRDKMWFGRFVYRDRTFNKKWNEARQSKYTFR
jgi:large subunit ribosomal protein L16